MNTDQNTFNISAEQLNKFNESQKETPEPENPTSSHDHNKEVSGESSGGFSIDDITDEKEEKVSSLEFFEDEEEEETEEGPEEDSSFELDEELERKKNNLWAKTIVNGGDLAIAKIGQFVTGDFSESQYYKFSAPTKEREMIVEPLGEVLYLQKKQKNPYHALIFTSLIVYGPIIFSIVIEALRKRKEKKKAKQRPVKKIVQVAPQKSQRPEPEKSEEVFNANNPDLREEKKEENKEPKQEKKRGRGRPKGSKKYKGRLLMPEEVERLRKEGVKI